MAEFELLEEKLLGEGSFGKVYQCYWYGSLAAAKLINSVEGADTSQEIKTIRILRNDYIIQFFGTVFYNNKLFLITSYAEKGSLRQALDRRILSNEQKPSIITGLIKGMVYLKSNNVVHRDLKSANVLLDSNCVPKICDFGLARLKLNSATHSTTTSSSVVGTPRWMAPELIGIQPYYSFASDVYALGVVIWEILTEEVPYADIVDADAICGLIEEGGREDIPDDIPEHYKSIIEKCWHLDPKDRISVEEINDLNDEAFLKLSTTPNLDVFDTDISTSIDHQNTGFEDTFQSEQIENTLHLVYNTLDYDSILHQYLEDTTSNLNNGALLASVLNRHGRSFTQWIVTETKMGRGAAATVLGEMYYHGCGVPVNYQAAIDYFSVAAKGNTSDHIDLEIKRLYTKDTKKGYARAQFNLGWMYENGLGVPQSSTKAVEWYTEAAEQGNVDAQNKLQMMYLMDRSVPQYIKAVEWYKKAAEQGDSSAQANLGWMYGKGRGVPQSNDKAVEWYTKAAEQGNANAQVSLGSMYLGGRGVPQSDDKAVEWYTKAAEQGNASAQFNLGNMYREGRGVPQSDDKAVEWYTKAAEQGNASAQNNLGVMYLDGRGVPQSDDKAVEWYTKAAEQGNASAQNNLGWMYDEGRGVPQSNDKAVEWYTKAAEQGNASAQFNLGNMYREGRGVPQSDDKAAEWFKKAAEQGNAEAQANLEKDL